MRSIGLLIFCCCLLSCQKQTQVEKANKEGILIVGNAAEPKSLDPQIVTGVIESKVITALFEGLVADHPSGDDTMAPGVALSWTPNKDYTRWTFKLNPDAKWSDKVPVTANDFVFAYHRMLHPELAAPYAEMLYFIKNAEEFNKAKIENFSEVGVKALDDFTLEVTMKEPVPFLPSITRHYTWFPVPKHVVINPKFFDESPFEAFSDWSKLGNLVGNGPFQLKEWVFNGHIQVERNPEYWDAENVGLNGIRFLPIENNYTESRAFLAGQLHTTYKLPSDLVATIKKEHPEYLRIEPYVGTVFFRCNTTKAPLDNEKVRQALGFAINREVICEHIYIGYSPARTLTPVMGKYQAPDAITHDPEAARKLLAEAGYPGGEGFPRLTVLISNKPDSKAAAEALQAKWQQDLGITIDIRSLDWGSYVTAQHELSYDLCLAGWIGDYLDPTTFLGMWTKGNGNNNTGWHSDEFETLLNEAALEPTQEARRKKLFQAESLFMKEMPIIPVAYYGRVYLHRPEVQGWHPLLLDNHPWKAISLKP